MRLTMDQLKYNYAFIGYRDYYLLSLSELAQEMEIVINPDPWNSYGAGLKQICRAHFSSNVYKYVDLPFKWIWRKGICKAEFSTKKPICFLLYGSHPTVYVHGLIPYIKKHYKNSAVVLQCTDKVEWYKKRFGVKEFDQTAEQADLVVTYNPVDAEKYGYELFPPIIPDYSGYPNGSNAPVSDILYVGRSKGRVDLLHSIYEKVTKAGLICDFTIIGVSKEERLTNTNINYDRFIDYRDVIDKINQTKCILNIPQEGAAGLSLRDYEAIGNHKYILTNNTEIESSPLLSRNQLILIDDNTVADYSRIRTPLLINSQQMKRLDWKNRIEWIEKKL